MTSDEQAEREIPARVAVVEAAIRVVVEDLGTGWRGKFSGDDVRRQMDRDASDRTIRRGLKDAAALGWVEDRRQGWRAGDRAEQYERVDQDDE
jgi:hypothetical protein